jgi:hypothetical protein
VRSRKNPSFLLLLFVLTSLFGAQARATACNESITRRWIGNLFEGRDRAAEYFNQRVRNQKIKKFDFDAYFAAKEELAPLEKLPNIPPRTEFEAHMAWLESAETRALETQRDKEFSKNLPTLEETLLNGTPRQKKALALWSRNYASRFEKGFTALELRRASADLTLILHDSRLDLGELTRVGLPDATSRFIKSEAHARIFEKGMLEVFGRKELIRPPKFAERVFELLQKKGFKWPINVVTNTGFFLSSKNLINGALITLPKHQIARVSARDLAELMAKGWQNEGERLTLKYAPQVQKQIVYNAFKNTLGDLSYGTTAFIVYRFVKNHFAYEGKLEEQRHRTEIEK